jgi:EAL domain-containing protein (putative c-di-GMP-specific phosphodiesterase class I)
MDDPDRVLPVLHALRRLGVSLSIDDFSSGCSSLAHLHRLPVNELGCDLAQANLISRPMDPHRRAVRQTLARESKKRLT